MKNHQKMLALISSLAMAAALAVALPMSSAAAASAVPGLRADSIGATDAALLWDQVPTATNYRVYWSTSASMPSKCEPLCKVIAVNDAGNPAVQLSAVFAGISAVRAGQVYYFKVSALKGSKAITGWPTDPLAVDLEGEPAPPTSTLDPIVATSTAATATAHFDPAAKGKAAELQALTIATSNTNEVTTPTWKKLASGKQDTGGNVVFKLSDPLEVSHQYRAVSVGETTNEVEFAAPPQSKSTGLAQLHFDTNEGASVNTRSRYFEGQFTMTGSSKFPACTAITPIAKSTMKGRGNYSWSFSKKSFTLKIDKKKDLCGMGSNKKWALVSNAYDKSLMRNAVAANLGAKFTNMAWTPKQIPVDFYMNGSYRGTYSLIERISIDPARVGIDELKAEGQATNPSHPNNVEPNITGGYIMEWDFRKGGDKNIKVGSRGYVGLKEPEYDYDKAGKKTDDGVSPQQVTYITKYLNDADKSLFGSGYRDDNAGWKKYIDMDSAVDYYLAMEMMKPVDGNMWASVYMYKPRGEKLQFGPMWDFDLSSGSAAREANTVSSSGWYLRNVVKTSAKQSSTTWFNRLNQDPDFTRAVKARWHELYPELSSNDFIDEQKSLMSAAASENFRKWSIRERISNAQIIKGSWSAEVSYLKAWMSNRRSWMNSQLR